MLIVNNEIFNHKDAKFKKTADRYKKLRSELESAHGKIIRFIRPVKRPRSSTGLMEPIPYMTVNLQANSVNPLGEAEYWLYADSLPKKKDGVFILSRTARFMGEDMVLSTETDMDLIFFLHDLSQQYKQKDFVIDNPKAKARAVADKKRNDAAVNTALYGALSPLADDEKLKNVAMSWGMSGVETKTGDQIRIEFEGILEKMDDQKKKDHRAKGTKEFLESLGNIDDEMRKRGLIKRGEDKKYIKYDSKTYKYVVSETNDELLFIPSKKMISRFDHFCDYMLKDANFARWANLKKVIIDEEFIDSITRIEDLRWLCREENINQKQKSLDSLKGELKEIYV